MATSSANGCSIPTRCMSDAEAVIDRLAAADRAYVEAAQAVESIDGTAVDEVGELVRRFESILDAYEDRATGSGDFGGYLTFRGEVTSFVSDLPGDQAGRDAFETAADHLDERRLQPAHFDRARAALAPAREIADAVAERRDAATELRNARAAARDVLEDLDEQVAHLEDLERFRRVDVDASVAPIEGPIDTYNAAVREAFDSFIHDEPASDVLDLFALAGRYPLVPVPTPPDRLVAAVRKGVGADLTLPELLEYATYSRSKLTHYVDDPTALKEVVAEHRRFLDRVTAEPFEVDWPPPPADELRWQLRELESLVGRFAGADTMAALRQVRARSREPDRFEELRTVATARATLDAADRRRLASGEVEAELVSTRDARQRVRDALAAASDPTDG